MWWSTLGSALPRAVSIARINQIQASSGASTWHLLLCCDCIVEKPKPSEQLLHRTNLKQKTREQIKLNKDNCQVSHLGKDNPGVHRLRSTWGLLERDLGSWWTTCSIWVSRVMMQHRHQWDAVLHQQGHPKQRQRNHPTLLSGYLATPGILGWVLVPIMQKRCGQAGDGPEKGHEDDQRTGKPAMWGKTERIWFAQPWEYKA